MRLPTGSVPRHGATVVFGGGEGQRAMWRRRRGSAQDRIDEAVREYLGSGRTEALQDRRLEADAEELLAAAAGAPPGSEPRARAVLHVGRLRVAQAQDLRLQSPLPDLGTTVRLVALRHDVAPEAVDPRLWELAVEFGADPVSRAQSALVLRDVARQEGQDDLAALIALRNAVSDLPRGHEYGGPLCVALAAGLLEHFERTGARGFLDDAVAWGREALARAPAAGRDRDGYLLTLGATLTRLSVLDDTPGNVAVLVEVCRKLLAVRPERSPERVDALAQLGGALHLRYRHTQALEDLDEAIALLRSAVDAGVAPERTSRGGIFTSLASAYHHRREVTGDPADLDGAIGAVESATAPDGLADRHEAAQWAELLASLRQERRTLAPQVPAPRPEPPTAHQRAEQARLMVLRAREQHDPLARDRGIELLGQALAELPEDFADRGPYSALLATALLARYRTGTADAADLEATLLFAREAVRLRHIGDPANQVAYLLVLAQATEARYLRAGDAADVDSAIALYRELVGLRPPRPDQQWHCLHSLGSNLMTRWRLRAGDASRSTADLDEGVERLRSALSLVQPPGEQYLQTARNLGFALMMRQESTGSEYDLRQAHACLSALASVLPAGDGRREEVSTLLETATARLREHREREEGLDPFYRNLEFISPHEEPGVPPEEAGRQGAGSAAVLRYEHRLKEALERYQATGDPALLDPAVDLGRRVLEGMPADHPRRPSVEARLGSLLLRRFEEAGDPADLDRAVEHLRVGAYGPDSHLQQLRILLGMPDAGAEELRAAADGRFGALLQPEPERGAELSALAAAYVRRFERDGAGGDLDEAVAAARRAVEADEPYDRVAHCSRLMTLGTVLVLRYRYAGATADLDQSIELGRRVLDETRKMSGPAVEELLRTALPALCNRLRSRYLVRAAPADLDEAVAYGRQALALETAEHPDDIAHGNLALALWDRALLHDDPGDLDAAVGHAQTVADGLPPASPRRAHALLSLASMLADRSVLRGRGGDAAVEQDAASALDGYAEAVQCLTSPPHERLEAAVRWGAFAARRAAEGTAGWEAAADGFAAAVELLPLTAWRGLDRGDRERLLAPRSSVATEAAACAIACGRLEEAVELLDQGRSVLWGQALDSRTDLSELAGAHPELADRFVALRAGLEQEAEAAGPGAADSAQRQRRLAREWDALVTEIRSRPGFAYFMLPVPFAELSQATAGGPLVLVNVSRFRCDALVVEPGRVRLVPLPALDAEEAQRRTERYLAAVDRLGRPGAAAGPVQQTVLDTLEWLWDAVAAPVLDSSGAAAWRGGRLWWCATGPLALLPVHAAGYHDLDDERPDDAVAERVVSSYMPTLRALARAARAGREGRVEGGRPRRLLLAAVSDRPAYAPSLAALPGVRREAEDLGRRFPAGHTLLSGADATRGRVLELLGSHPCVHFACHGGQNLADPALGALYLHDGPLTVTDLARLDLASAELAVLSACQTAVGGTDLPNEAIHLAGALLLGNFRQVVSTLWTVGDDTARRVADLLYGALADGAGSLDPSRAPYALHEAVARIRREDPYRPLAWASYVHFGP
ncbi:CHAT domain-containing protein [Streptomyces sp. NPDC046876]|uniref:CHAT domain-containing protein n=1 Tax=Streptomyces sp. NPDC046876 TaxID=3155616 RepID=UPI00341179AD